MDIQYYGGNCIVLSTKGIRIVVDDTLRSLGLKPVTKPGDVALFTGPHQQPGEGLRLAVDAPGEYEVSGISIIGIAAQSHMDEPGMQHATMYKIIADDTSYVCTGHVHPDLSDEQLEKINRVDVMFVPVGGNGYTLDPAGALQLIRKIEPKLVVPTHYADAAIQYPVEQQSLEQALKVLSLEPIETVAKLRFKPADSGDTTQLVVLTRS